VPLDLDVFDGIIAGIAPPPQKDHDVLHEPRDFCADRGRGQEQSRQA